MSETWGWPEVGQFAQAAGRSSLLVPKHTKVPGLVLHTQHFQDLLAWGAVTLCMSPGQQGPCWVRVLRHAHGTTQRCPQMGLLISVRFIYF